MMGLDNPLHIAFLLVILLLVFGAKRLPEMGRSLGEGLRGFKTAVSSEGTTPAPAIAAPAVPAETPSPAHAANSATEARSADTVPSALTGS